MMQVYLVGGAVRDELLSYPFTERDWVVVGATPELMLSQGYQQVGKDFPVFLHPVTKEEYALARTERKQGTGYTGFAVHAEPSVTLEEDLQRRDLTINAMAKSSTGTIVDPYGGLADLKAKRLKHVSPAFAEDPLRVLRVARFAARYASLGFTVAEETLDLMTTLVGRGELLTLSPERIWRETEKALLEKSPVVYFEVLRRCGALQILLPEVDALFGVPQNPLSHPEIDTGEHSFMVLQQAANLTSDSAVRYAALVHDVGKALTPRDKLPSHPGHELASLSLLDKIQQRLKVPNRHADLAKIVARYHTCLHGLKNSSAADIQDMMVALGVFRQGDFLQEFIACCRADHMGRLGFEQQPYPQANWLVELVEQCQTVDVQKIVADGYSGASIGQQLVAQRQAIICQFLTTNT